MLTLDPGRWDLWCRRRELLRGGADPAGGGTRGGLVVGSSDKHAAFPQPQPVDPVDIQATMYRGLGLNSQQLSDDCTQRPWESSTGRVIRKILA